jgi:hypothetical protein
MKYLYLIDGEELDLLVNSHSKVHQPKMLQFVNTIIKFMRKLSKEIIDNYKSNTIIKKKISHRNNKKNQKKRALKVKWMKDYKN